MYLVLDGEVEIRRGGSATAVVVGSGGLLGEAALLGGVRDRDAVAATPTVVREVPPGDMLRFLEARPHVADRVAGTLAERSGMEDVEGLPAAISQMKSHFENLLASAIQDLARAEGRGGTAVEVFPVLLSGGAISWLRPVGRPPLQARAGAGAQPGDAAIQAVGSFGLSPRLVHSTSWRTESDHVVLTYLAVLRDGVAIPSELEAVPAARTDLARGSATGPPPEIRTDHVVEHALRHLAWLSRDDPVVRRELSTGWRLALASYVPEPFRSMDDVR